MGENGAGRLWLVVLVVLARSWAGGISPAAAEPTAGTAGVVWGETYTETATRTGYSVAELQKYFPPLPVAYDSAGLAEERLAPPPSPGIHPRIAFNPEDLPARRQAVATPSVASRVYQQLVATVARGLTGERARFRGLYDQLAAGDTAGIDVTKAIPLLRPLHEEAYRCLIEEDDAAGAKVARATASIARLLLPELAHVNPTNDWQGSTNKLVGRDGLAWCYDLAHGWMTEADRMVTRQALAAATAGKWCIGMDALPAWEANMMNWIPWLGGELLVSALAIEGEEGYDETLLPRIAQAYERLMLLGFFASGASYEGMGKNSPRIDFHIPLAKRGYRVVAQTHTRRFLDQFRLHTLQPWGGAFIQDGNWGGSLGRGNPADLFAMKWAYPDDPKVDFVFRSLIEPLERADQPIRGVGLHLFPVDYDRSISWEASLARATGTEPLTFFCPDRGLVISRTGWNPEALHLSFQPRSIVGGHRHGSRNTFLLSSHGRVWIDFTNMAGGSAVGDVLESRYQNVTLIDGVGQAYECPPGRMVAFADTPLVTTAAGDARFAYSVRRLTSVEQAAEVAAREEAGEPLSPGPEPIEICPNDFRLTPSDLPWMSLPWKLLPDWYSGQKLPIYGQQRRGITFTCSHERKWEANWTWKDDPVARAFRTVALVRGRQPYVLLAEDIQKDESEHLYEFLMQLPDDVELESAITLFQAEDGRGLIVPPPTHRWSGGQRDATGRPIVVSDMVLKERQGDRRLLIRLLECAGEITDDGRPARLETYVRNARWQRLGKRLVIPSRSVAPNYKLLLYPHRRGEPKPVTSWSTDRSELRVEWPGQRDRVRFATDADGRTGFRVTRSEGELAGADRAAAFPLESLARKPQAANLHHPQPPVPPPAGVMATTYDHAHNHYCLVAKGESALLVLSADQPQRWRPVEPQPIGDDWQTVLADEVGGLWVAGKRKLLRLDPLKPAAGWDDARGRAGFPDGAIEAIGLGPDGLLRVAVGAGLLVSCTLADERKPADYVWGARTPTVAGQPLTEAVSHIAADRDGRLLITAGGRQLASQPAADAWQRHWELVARLPGSNHDLSGDLLGDSFFMAGGRTTAWGYPARLHDFAEVFRFAYHEQAGRGKWDAIATLPHPLVHCGTSHVGGHLVVVGGDRIDAASKRHEQAAVFFVNPATGDVTEGPPLAWPRPMPIALHVNGRVYVAGNPQGAADEPGRLESLGPGEQSWRQEPDGPAGFGPLAGCLLGDEIFLAVPHKYLAVFNTQTATWRTVAVPRPPRSCQMAGYRDEVWLLGGRGVRDGREVQILNPATGQWRRGPDLPRELVWGCAAVVDGRLMVAGGAAGSCYSNRTWMLREANAPE